ncbi:nuclear envelope integral membrane protein 1 isoform X2 [Strongylocentrotus purpuratus]|uniref:Nuclear envelope integral membrane protein 1 n=1 Tax=Strongylocentrotus purpuratus TaxID=7668 RepID=A0A7M7THB6_STRPU|nr:nuclear envelope integral membrane protein 1 isoform X2 [Strongylocentrotus purpuratus]|eukprot:XP_795501.3 PREDICTED: transmembrane protein 194A isoform X2 [Strongylocentrotus purpuratus]
MGNISFLSLTFLLYCCGSLHVGLGADASSPSKKSFPPWETKSNESAGFHIYCHSGSKEWLVLKFLSSVTVMFTPMEASETLLLYIGNNASAVEGARDSAGIFKKLQFFSPWSSTKQRLSPFQDTCVGVVASGGFELVAHQRTIDVLYLSLLLIGLTLYLISPALSRNYIFHYSSGVAIGVLASLLILIYVFSRLVPKKTGAMSLLVGGWALVGFFMRWIVENYLTVQYKGYIMGYIILASMISFAVCYRYGPVTDKRTENILRWGLQLIGLTFIYNCSQLEGASIAIIAILLVYRWIPQGSIRALKNISIWIHRPTPRLLTVDEFEEQGREETKKALKELRQYCSSPKCNAWKAVTRLESPKRFAEFVSGEGHVSQDELDFYASDVTLISEDDLMTSDSSNAVSSDEEDSR